MVYHYRQIWKISYPILAGLIIQQLIGFTDTAFLGRVGETELGASALASIFYIMIFMLGHGFSIGAQIIAARRNGEKNYQRIGAVIYQGTFFLLLAAAAIILILSFSAPYLLSLVISSPQILEAALAYLEPRIWGFLFAFTIVMFRAFYIGITETKILTWNALLMLCVNVGLDYVLIFGKLGFPAMGIEGAAIASVISEAVSAAFFIFYTFFKTDVKKYGFDKITFINFKVLKEIWLISVWTMMQSFLSLGTWLMFMLAIEHLGESELAISNILRNITAIPFMIVAALGGAANSITSNLIGSGHDNDVMRTSYRIVILAYLAGLAAELVMALFPQTFMHIFSDNAELINAAVPAYYTSLTTFITLVPGIIFLSVVSGTGDTKKAMFLELAAMAVYVLNVWYVVIYLRADIAVCWTSEHSNNIVLAWLTYRYLKKNNWCCKII